MNKKKILATFLSIIMLASSMPFITQSAKLPDGPAKEYIVPAEKPILDELVCNDTVNASKWSVQNNLKINDTTYGDNTSKLTDIPPALLGSNWIRTANASKNFSGNGVLASFKVYRAGTLYIALPTGEGKPAWMTDYAKSSLTIKNGAVMMDLYEKAIESGTTVGLNSAGTTNNYIAIYTTRIIDLAPPLPSITKFSTTEWDAGWYRMETNLQTGTAIYSVDPDPIGADIKNNENSENYKIKTIPEKLIGSDYIINRKVQRKDVYFFAEQDIVVYAAVDAGYGKNPAWESGWEITEDTMTTNDNTSYNIFKKPYKMGEIVLIKKLGNNNDQQKNFFLMILPDKGLPVSKALTNNPVLPEGTRNPNNSSDNNYQYYVNDVFNMDTSNGVPTGYIGFGANDNNKISISEIETPIIPKVNLATNSHYYVNNASPQFNFNPVNCNILTEYWQSASFPGELKVDLGSVKAVNQVTLKVMTSWPNRTQNIEIKGSINGTDYTTLVAAKDYEFKNSEGNEINIAVPLTTARYIQVVIFSNTGSSSGAQVGRIEIYGPDRSEDFLPAGTNLALGCPFQVSSDEYNGGSPVDGDPTSYWRSADVDGGAVPGILTVDLKDKLTVNRVAMRLWPRWGDRTQNLEIQGSEDGITYQTLEAAKNYVFTAWDNTIHITFADTKTRYLRVVGTSNTGNEGIQVGEMEAYGPDQSITNTVILKGSRSVILDKKDREADMLGVKKTLDTPIAKKVILETRVKSNLGNQLMDIPLVKDSNGKTVAAVSFGKNGFIKAVSAGADVDLIPYKGDTWYNIKLVMNTKTGTYDIWVDHLRKANGIAFAERATNIKTIEYSVNKYAAGALEIDYLKLYDDTEVYTLEENFTDLATGSKPAKWNYINTSSAVISEVPFKEDKSLKVENIGTPVKVEKDFTPISGDVTIETKVKPMNSGWVTAPIVTDAGGKVAAKVAIYRNSFFISNGDNWIYICDQEVPNNYYESGNWFYIKLVMNTDTKRYDFYIDGAKRYSGASFVEKVDSVSKLGFGLEQENTLYINNVKVFDSASLARGMMPKEDVFNVKDFGAKGDGVTDDTVAIAKAIKAAAYTGGTVLLENGTFYTGQITPESDMTLFIDASAEIFAKMDRNVYDKVVPSDGYNGNRQLGRGIIFFQNEKNVRITGGGTIYGNGFYAFNQNDPPNQRPCILYFAASEDVTVENVNMVQSPFWTLVPYESRNMTIRNVDITNHVAPNRDGIDPVNSSNLTVENCKVIAGDDAFCPKSGNMVPSYNVEVRNCFFQSDCNGIKFGTDSQGPFKNYIFEDIYMKRVGLSGITLQSVDGSEIENITFRRIDMTDVDNVLFVCVGNRYRTPIGVPNSDSYKKLGYIRDLVFEDINFLSPMDHPYCHRDEDVHEAMLIGLDPAKNTINDGKDHRISNVLFKNVHMEMLGGSNTIPQFSGGIGGGYPEHAGLGASTGSAYTLRWTDNVRFENCTNTILRPDVRQEIAQADYTNTKIVEPLKPMFEIGTPDLTVPQGVEQSEITFPSTVKVLLETGEIVDAEVAVWTPKAGYDANTEGAYTFEASFKPNDAVQGINQLKSSLQVLVRSKTFITSIASTPDVIAKNGTLAKDLSLPEKTTITLSDGSTKEVAIDWDTSDYNPYSEGITVLFGSFAEDLDYENIHGLRATVKVSVDAMTLKLGDVNGDGKLTVTDIVSLRSYIMRDIEFTEEQLIVANVDGDAKGDITVTDIVALRKLIMND